MRSPMARTAAVVAVALPLALLHPATFALWSSEATVGGVTINVSTDEP